MDTEKLPKMFYVNWFRKDANGKFLWPGYGDNSRVLEWVFERCGGGGDAVETPIGYLPARSAIPVDGVDVTPEAMAELLRVDIDDWQAEIPSIAEHFAGYGDKVPQELHDELNSLKERLDHAARH
jgi:phosphoenolpyruvate carboxykinase (GTP)